MAGMGMNIGDYIGLQAVNGLVSGCIGLLRDKNMHNYRMSEMTYQARLNEETMIKGKQLDYQFQQQLQLGRFKHELEAMQLGKEIDFQNGVRLQMLSHTFRIKEAESMFEQQMALRDREDNKLVWPLQTAIGQADLFRKDSLASFLPVNVFVVANDEFKCTEVEQEINRSLESFFAYRGFGLNTQNAVFGRFGSWKPSMYSKKENINILWSVMKGVPVMVIRPEFRKFGKILQYRILFWGNSINQDGYTEEEVFACPYDISEETKKELLVEEVSPVLCCFAGIFCDCYHLIERGVMPQVPFAMKSVFGGFPVAIEDKVVDIYKSALYAITQTNYLGDYTPVAYLNVIKSLLAIGSENSRLVGTQLLLESMAVWENGFNSMITTPVIPSSFEMGVKRMKEVVAKSGIGNPEYIKGLYNVFTILECNEMAGQIKALDRSNQLIEMIEVEGGAFKMGGIMYDNEKPIHTVNLDTYYIGKYLVTQHEWEIVMEGSNPSRFKGKDRPVEQVTWYDAVRFCNALSKREGFDECYKINGAEVILDEKGIGYRLPTEAEWEYAVRGGNKNSGYRYAAGDNIDNVAWHEGNSGSQTHSVGQKYPNELGLYDMSGNVWEWCWDWYDSSYYPGSPNKNPTGPSTGSDRVIRGGSWVSSPARCAVADRFSISPGNSYGCLGLRLVFACSSK